MVTPILLKTAQPKAVKPWLMQAKPTYPGGQEALQRFVADHLEIPDFLLEQGIEGQAELLLFIDSNGDLSQVVLKGVPMSPRVTGELKRCMAEMRRWKPAIQGGRPIPSKVLVPLFIRR